MMKTYRVLSTKTVTNEMYIDASDEKNALQIAHLSYEDEWTEIEQNNIDYKLMEVSN